MRLPPERDLPAGRLADRTEHLMAEITAPPRRAPRRARWVVAGVVAFTAVAAPAAGVARHVIQHGDNVEVDGTGLAVVYEGRRITRAQLAELQERGKARYTAVDVESARQGVEHAFDSEAELDAWGRQHVLDRAPR